MKRIFIAAVGAGALALSGLAPLSASAWSYGAPASPVYGGYNSPNYYAPYHATPVQPPYYNNNYATGYNYYHPYYPTYPTDYGAQYYAAAAAPSYNYYAPYRGNYNSYASYPPYGYTNGPSVYIQY